MSALETKGLRLLVCLWLALTATSALGCTSRVVVSAPILYPARVPVRAFPTILIAGNTLPEGDLIERLRAHLAKDGQHEVKRVEVADLETLRDAGAISRFTLVLMVVPAIYNEPQSDWSVVPVQMCDFYYGCFTQYQSVYTQLPQLLGQVTLTVYEGPSARTLQTTTLEAAVYQPDGPAARKQVIERLGLQLERAVDVLESVAKVELEPVDEHPIVRDAIANIRQGKWNEGRSLLEQAAAELGGLRHGVQARIWYDLAMARWFAPGPEGLTQPAFEAASRALAEAIRLDGSSRYQRASERLKLARQRQQVLEEQRRAATYNYKLKGETPAPP